VAATGTTVRVVDDACAATAERVERALNLAAHLVGLAMAELAAVATEDYLPGDLAADLGGLTGMLLAAREHIAGTDVVI